MADGYYNFGRFEHIFKNVETSVWGLTETLTVAEKIYVSCQCELQV